MKRVVARQVEDLERINGAADQLNFEAEDVLEYQASDDLASMGMRRGNLELTHYLGPARAAFPYPANLAANASTSAPTMMR
jgi:hypothetical protein